MSAEVVIAEQVINSGPGAQHGPEIMPNTGPSAQDLAVKAAATRVSKRALVADKVEGVEAPAKVEGSEGSEAAGAGEATSETASVTPSTSEESSEKSRLERVKLATEKAKSADRARSRKAAQHAETERQLAASRAESARYREIAQRGQQLEERFRADPLGALAAANVTTDQIVQRAIAAGSPDEKIAALQSQIEQERNLRKQWEETTKAERHAAAIATAREECWRLAQDAERYPHLKGHPKEAVLALVMSTAKQARDEYRRSYGTELTLTDRQVLRYLNDLYKPEEVAKTPAKAETSKVQSAKKAPRAITNAAANGAITRPSNWENLSRAERIKALKGS